MIQCTDSPHSVTIFTFPRCWGLPNMSPYCVKLESYLLLSKLPFQRRVGDLRTAPRGQMPYARIDDEVLGDSDHIIERLAALTGNDLDEHLPEVTRARHRGLGRMLEESTVWVLRYGRFIDQGYTELQQFMNAILPPVLGVILKRKIRGDMRKALLAQGLGRYSPQDIYGFGFRDIDAVAAELGDRPFFGGERPCRLDCTVFGFTANFACEHARSPLTDHVARKPNLIGHIERMRELCYPELPSWIGMKRGGTIDEQ